MIDILGREIQVGDIVAHGQRSGNSGCITLKLVTETKEFEDHHWYTPRQIGEVKVIGFAERSSEWNKETKEWEPVPKHYVMNDRGGWTTSDVLMVINDIVKPDIKEFLRSNL